MAGRRAGYVGKLLAGITLATLATVPLVLAAPEMGDSAKGEEVYRVNCYVCHGVDPSHDGPLGPAIKGTNRELLKIRLEKGGNNYPKDYKPKRTTAVMPPMAHLVGKMDDLLAYINGIDKGLAAKKTTGLKPAAESGKALFLATCSGCHQPEGRGKVGLAPSLTDRDFLALVSDTFITKTVTNGRPGTNMIAFGFLGKDKIAEIVAYLRSFQQGPSRKYSHNWKAKGSAKLGQERYQQACAPCHGVNGKGYLLGGSGTGIGLNGFLNVASDAYIKQVMLSGREGTPMRAFGGPNGLAQLTDAELNAIIVYLRQLGKLNAPRK